MQYQYTFLNHNAYLDIIYDALETSTTSCIATACYMKDRTTTNHSSRRASSRLTCSCQVVVLDQSVRDLRLSYRSASFEIIDSRSSPAVDMRRSGAAIANVRCLIGYCSELRVNDGQHQPHRIGFRSRLHGCHRWNLEFPHRATPHVLLACMLSVWVVKLELGIFENVMRRDGS